jgi:tRNA/tmRNA/rRNA uracil-C5-methylase (TrmA/RlmC/RlmD family)
METLSRWGLQNGFATIVGTSSTKRDNQTLVRFPVRKEVSQKLNKHLKMTEQIVFDVYNAEGKRLNQSGLTQEEVFNFVQQLQESKVDAKFSIRSRPAR